VKQIQPVKYEFSQLFKSAKELTQAGYQIILSDHDEPGTRISSSIQPLCSIKLKFRADQFETFPVWTNAIGKKYRLVYCTLEMSVTVSSIEWAVACNGNRVPTVIEYQQTELEARLPT
jgi:hypothetical protein